MSEATQGGKKQMSADASAADKDARRPDAARFSPEVAAEMHRARHAASHGGRDPCPLTPPGTAHLFACTDHARAAPYTCDALTLTHLKGGIFNQSSKYSIRCPYKIVRLN